MRAAQLRSALMLAMLSLTSACSGEDKTSQPIKPEPFLETPLAPITDAIIPDPEHPMEPLADRRPVLRDGRYALIPFAAHEMKPRDYTRELHPLIGAAQYKHLEGWEYAFENLIPQPDGSMIARIDGTTMSALKWERELAAQRLAANYKLEATLPDIRPGMVVAPLWLFSEGAPDPNEAAHEWDFEFMHDRLELNLHNGNGGFLLDAIHRDFSGHRVLLEIDRVPGAVTMRLYDLTDGFGFERTFTPDMIAARASEPNAPEGLRFPEAPMFPMMEFWVSNAEGWAGKAEDYGPGMRYDMILHGYSITPY